MNNILEQNQRIGKYRVQNLIKGGHFNETYRVVDDNDDSYFLKIFVMKRVPAKLIDEETSEVREILNCQRLVHKNIISYVESGKVSLDVGECSYLITNYFSGELLVEKIQRDGRIEFEEAVSIFKDLLEGLRYMHSLCPVVLHNDITPRNIMLPKSTAGCTEIIDMGHTSSPTGGVASFETADLDVRYCAGETFVGMYSQQSDIFSAVAVFYTMLFGHAPWDVTLDADMPRAEKIKAVKKQRKEELDFSGADIEPVFCEIIRKGLAKSSLRYSTISELLSDINSRSVHPIEENDSLPNTPPQSQKNQAKSNAPDNENAVNIEMKQGKGNGFADIAGMADLKQLLRTKVISVIQDKEKAARYRLTPPNGMLLYGPPGCGKTYFAEKFAEETQFNFFMVKASDIASIYVHGTQGKIAELFRKAEENQPAVLCFDEFDALVPNRSMVENPGLSGEVNEFLSQLNNCSQRGIFVIATSNRPDKIDPAVLRTGRIDRQIYVPLPDEECRREMFAHHLQGRPYDESEIVLDELVALSDGYVASDISYVVNDAASIAAYNDSPITMAILKDVIQCTKPSVNKDVLKSYDELRDVMNGIERRSTLPQVGFRTP